MKRFLLLLLLATLCTVVFAQQKLAFSVVEFEQDVFDTSAKSTEHGKKDGNGTWYAIIKVTSSSPDDDITGCQFNFGNMACRVEKHDDALWLYVQRNAKTVTITRPGYYTINKYDLQTTIEAGANYRMVLKGATTHQRLFIKCSPANAIVMIDGKMIDTENGKTQMNVKLGDHKYAVMAAGYYQQDGIIEVNEDSPANLIAELIPKETSSVKPVPQETTLQPSKATSIPKDLVEKLKAVESNDLEPMVKAFSGLCDIKWNKKVEAPQKKPSKSFMVVTIPRNYIELGKGIEVDYDDDRTIQRLSFITSQISSKTPFPLTDSNLTWNSSLDEWENYFKSKGIRIKIRNESSLVTSYYVCEEGFFQLMINKKTYLTKASVSLGFVPFN